MGLSAGVGVAQQIYHPSSAWLIFLVIGVSLIGVMIGARSVVVVASRKGLVLKKKKKRKKRKKRRALVGSTGVRLMPGIPIWRSRLNSQLAGETARRLVDLAAMLAGRKRPDLRDEWYCHLAGESGHDPLSWRKVRAALGFIIAAAHYRFQDIMDMGWCLVDGLLRSRTLSNIFVWVPAMMASELVFSRKGLFGVLTNAGSLIALGGLLYGAIRIGRWWRGVNPSAPNPRRAKD